MSSCNVSRDLWPADRQTTRLMQAMVVALADGYSVVLITINRANGVHILERLHEAGISKHTTDEIVVASTSSQALNMLRGRRPRRAYRWFYDEFDFIADQDVQVLEDGYYATTPKRHRNVQQLLCPASKDPMVLLLRANDGIYESKFNVNAVKRMEAAYKQTPAEFKLEMCAEFMQQKSPTPIVF